MEELFDLNLVLVLKIVWHVCEAVFENDKKNNISPAVLCLCHKITDIHSAMFFQDQCNLPGLINDHTRL